MAKRPNKIDIITWVLLIIVLISNIFTLYTAIATRDDMPIKVKQVVNSSVQKIDYSKINSVIDKIVSDKIKALNITQPKDGEDSVSTIEKTTETIIKEVPVKGGKGDSAYDIAIKNGFSGSEKDWVMSLKGDTPLQQLIRCNTSKNKWETSFNGGITWVSLLDENKKVVKCISN